MERFKWWLLSLRDTIEGSSDAKFVGALAIVVLLAAGGYVAADKVSQAGAETGGAKHLVRLVTTVREPVTTRIHGHAVVHWRLRREVVEAQAQTVMERQTIRTPSGTKVVSRPVVRYRKKVVKVNGKTSTVLVPQTVTDSQTTTVSRTQTEVQTVTDPVTVVRTQTVVSTVTLPGTTVTLPGTTVTVTVPGGDG